jgi:hypothetical protein
MTRLDLIESVKTELGHPVITLFVKDEQINTMISRAIRKCQSKACPTFLANKVVSGGKIDISDLNLETVKNVYTDTSSGSSNDIFGLGVFNYADQTQILMDSARLAGQRAELEKIMLYDYYIDKDTLYLDNYSGNVAIEYIKKDLDFMDLDSEWRGWVESYVVAVTKVIEGRIRGKYKISSGPFEVEADQLISEGSSSLQELESKLDTSMGYFNILR